MNFFLKYPAKPFESLIIHTGGDIPAGEKNQLVIWMEGASEMTRTSDEKSIFIFLGDLIMNNPNRRQDRLRELADTFSPNSLKDLKGHFYILKVNEVSKSVEVYNSLFSILPVYYSQQKANLFIASRNEYILRNSEVDFLLNRRWYLERVLFNYQLFNQTPSKNILLLPANSGLITRDNRFYISRHLEIADHFLEHPGTAKTSLSDLAELFKSNFSLYEPPDPFAISFTSGFDSRSLIAMALDTGRDFTTYSFGSEQSKDITIPRTQSEALNLPYRAFLLDHSYIKKFSFEAGQEMVDISEGNASFARAHYVYAARELSGKHKYIITGNFGSEIFRAMHHTGVMISGTLLQILLSKSGRSIIEILKNVPELNWLNYQEFRHDLEELSVDLENMVFANEFKNRNFLLYKLIFEEIFRKYFGPEIIMQFRYVVNRTPFLDYSFIKAALQTRYSGVYSRLFEKNLLNRFKGQVFYSYIMKRYNKPLYRMNTGKGYGPVHVLSPQGKLIIAMKFAGKLAGRSQSAEDDYAVQKNFYSHLNICRSLEPDPAIFNGANMQSLLNSDLKDPLLNKMINAISMAMYHEKLIKFVSEKR